MPSAMYAMPTGLEHACNEHGRQGAGASDPSPEESIDIGGGDGSSELIQKQVLLSGENQSVPGGMHAIAGRKLSVPRTVATGLLIIIAAITTTITVINGRRIIITISTHSISLIIAKPCQSSGAYS